MADLTPSERLQAAYDVCPELRGPRDALEEILFYAGGADSALEDEYVMERAQEAFATIQAMESEK